MWSNLGLRKVNLATGCRRVGVRAEAEGPMRKLFQESSHKLSGDEGCGGEVEEVGAVFIEMNNKAA